MTKSTGTELSTTERTKLLSKLQVMFKGDSDMRKLARRICHRYRIPYYVLCYKLTSPVSPLKDKWQVSLHLDPEATTITTKSSRQSVSCIFNYHCQLRDYPTYLITWDKKEKELNRCSRVVIERW